MSIALRPPLHDVGGYRAHAAAGAVESFDVTTEEYGHQQLHGNTRITRDFVEPLCRRTGSRRVLDVGCGVGQGVLTLAEDGFDAYGVDLASLTPFWRRLDCPRDRFFVVDAVDTRMPFDDATFDFAYSFGVIEHVGTTDGRATRRADYHDIRRRWLLEIMRVVRPGGHVLLGGPNRNFPVDMSHALDGEASVAERWVSRVARVSVHRPWGGYFLWGYDDVRRYLADVPHRLEALSVHRLLVFGRVPRPLRPVVRAYVRAIPRAMLGTGLNPWVVALVQKLPADGPTAPAARPAA